MRNTQIAFRIAVQNSIISATFQHHPQKTEKRPERKSKKTNASKPIPIKTGKTRDRNSTGNSSIIIKLVIFNIDRTNILTKNAINKTGQTSLWKILKLIITEKKRRTFRRIISLSNNR